MATASKFVSKYISGFLSLIYPQLCSNCGLPLNNNNPFLCRKCTSKLPLTGFENWYANPVHQCFWGRVQIKFASSIFHYRKGELLQQLIFQLKYRNIPEAGIFLGQMAGRVIKKSSQFSNIDAIIPLPLHPKKLRLRGYNQSEMIAKGISETLGAPINTTSVIRRVFSTSQTKKDHYSRWENVDGVFAVENEECLQYKNLLLVDDILTTGATIEACCNAIAKINGVNIYVLTVGYTNNQ